MNAGESIFLYNSFDTRIESSKLHPFQGMKAIRIFCPSASSPMSIEGPSANISLALTTSLDEQGVSG